MAAEAEGGFKCAQCNKLFATKKILRRHTIEKHPDGTTGPRKFACKDCGKVFKRPSHLQRHHLVVHSDNMTEQKLSVATMTDHKRKHECPVCDAKFKQLCHLKQHMHIHKGTRFKCTLCEKTFSRNSTLRQHVISCHDMTTPSSSFVAPNNDHGSSQWNGSLKVAYDVDDDKDDDINGNGGHEYGRSDREIYLGGGDGDSSGSGDTPRMMLSPGTCNSNNSNHPLHHRQQHDHHHPHNHDHDHDHHNHHHHHLHDNKNGSPQRGVHKQHCHSSSCKRIAYMRHDDHIDFLLACGSIFCNGEERLLQDGYLELDEGGGGGGIGSGSCGAHSTVPVVNGAPLECGSTEHQIQCPHKECATARNNSNDSGSSNSSSSSSGDHTTLSKLKMNACSASNSSIGDRGVSVDSYQNVVHPPPSDSSCLRSCVHAEAGCLHFKNAHLVKHGDHFDLAFNGYLWSSVDSSGTSTNRNARNDNGNDLGGSGSGSNSGALYVSHGPLAISEIDDGVEGFLDFLQQDFPADT